ncbi:MULTISPECIES: maleylpyruvate isomerase family mycothiol-dependent enzyme [unclassified Ornithinimicrobium]|uniref:maleylpyruvate isomerase family mycothiol-dependent enzyme n=1 Tax=unclassified Ornithinimicrobium TaxID=2615080 RepID=UPI0038539126
MDRLAVIRTESQHLADVLATVPPSARVPSCPEWDAGDLLWHLTEVHSFWAGILAGDVRTEDGVEAVEAAVPPRPPTTAEVLALRERATADLLAQLERLDDAEPRWSWWDADQTVGFTRRMQTYEATMHRVDAELTADLEVGTIAADVATGAVDHCADVMWATVPEWATEEQLAVVALVADDTQDRWLVDVGRWTGTGPESGTEFDWPFARRSTGGAPTVTVTGSVQDLALWAWGRGGSVQVEGSRPGVEAVDALIAHGIQ